jgi:hypothetical protein
MTRVRSAFADAQLDADLAAILGLNADAAAASPVPKIRRPPQMQRGALITLVSGAACAALVAVFALNPGTASKYAGLAERRPAPVSAAPTRLVAPVAAPPTEWIASEPSIRPRREPPAFARPTAVPTRMAVSRETRVDGPMRPSMSALPKVEVAAGAPARSAPLSRAVSPAPAVAAIAPIELASATAATVSAAPTGVETVPDSAHRTRRDSIAAIRALRRQW